MRRSACLSAFAKKSLNGIAALVLSTAAVAAHADYSKHPNAQPFIERMVKEHGFKEDEVRYVLAGAEKKESILKAIAKPAEKRLTWWEYRRIFLDDKRIRKGVDFWKQHAQAIKEASEQYSVDPEIIVAIIGVETRYGENMGSHRVIDALATLGLDYPPRSSFFSKELESFLLLTREQKQDPFTLKGSYAGAMGYGQFMPSSYRAYARDYDGDGIVDIWTNPEDAIASVANYFRAHGWERGGQVLVPVGNMKAYRIKDSSLNNGKRPKLTQSYLAKQDIKPAVSIEDRDAKVALVSYQDKAQNELWMGLPNFYTITRYNRSRLYARSVWELSQAIQERYNQTL